MKPLIFVLLFSLALPATAETNRFADITYTLLDGWVPGSELDGGKVFLSDLPSGQCSSCRYYLGASEPHSGTAGEYLTDALIRFEKRPERFHPLGAPKTFTISGHKAEMAIYLYDQRKLYVFTTLDLGDRKALLTFRGNYDDKQELKAQLAIFGDQIAPYFNTLRFGGFALPPAIPGRMSGVWWSWNHGVATGLDGMTTTRVQHRHLVFFPDGHVYMGTPPFGTSTVDRAEAIDSFDKNFGVYREQRDRLSLTFLDGRQVELARTSTGLSDDTHIYTKVKPLSDGTRLKGELTKFSYTALSDGGASQYRNLYFRSDGRFEGKKIGTVSNSAMHQSRQTALRGEYRVQDGLLVMNDMQGNTISSLIYQTSHGIMIGNDFFEGAIQ